MAGSGQCTSRRKPGHLLSKCVCHVIPIAHTFFPTASCDVVFGNLKCVARLTKGLSNEFEKRLRATELKLSSASMADNRGGAADVPVVYHYTDPKGLIGILSESQLWATDIRFLNDSSELRYAEELQRKILQEIISESPDGSLQKKLAEKTLEDRLDLRGDTYVVCFCAKDDLLTQWKAYGSSGSGFSIGFDREKLKSMLAELAPHGTGALWVGMTEVILARVRYSRRDQKRELRRAFDQYGALLSAGSSGFEIDKCADAIANTASGLSILRSRLKRNGES